MNVLRMVEIELPCCEAVARVEALDGPIHCDRCGIDLELAPDGPAAVPATP